MKKIILYLYKYMLEIRHINESDYYHDYLNLLKQLTKLNTNKIDYNLFTSFIKGLGVHHQIIVLEDTQTKKIVGTITLLIEQKLIRDYGKVAHIEDVVVDNNYRGQGLGKKLINEAMKIAKENNCYKIILDCDNHNIKFYEKCNFEHKGAFMAHYY